MSQTDAKHVHGYTQPKVHTHTHAHTHMHTHAHIHTHGCMRHLQNACTIVTLPYNNIHFKLLIRAVFCCESDIRCMLCNCVLQRVYKDTLEQVKLEQEMLQILSSGRQPDEPDVAKALMSLNTSHEEANERYIHCEYTLTWTQSYSKMCTHTCTHIHTCTHARMHTHTHTRACTCTHTHMYVRMHTHIKPLYVHTYLLCNVHVSFSLMRCQSTLGKMEGYTLSVVRSLARRAAVILECVCCMGHLNPMYRACYEQVAVPMINFTGQIRRCVA